MILPYLFRLPGYGGGGVGGGDGGGVPPRRCFTKISDMTEQSRHDLHGARERTTRHPII